MKIKVDTELCGGHAMCAMLAPDVFKLDDAGFVLAPEGVIEVPAEADEGNVREAVLSCPEGALAVDE